MRAAAPIADSFMKYATTTLTQGSVRYKPLLFGTPYGIRAVLQPCAGGYTPMSFLRVHSANVSDSPSVSLLLLLGPAWHPANYPPGCGCIN